MTIKLYAGSSASGSPVQTLTATRQANNSYTVNASTPLANGTYTAQAEQQDTSGNTGQSTANTFTVSVGPADTTPPVVSLSQPADGATVTTATPSFAGTAGNVAGDSGHRDGQAVCGLKRKRQPATDPDSDPAGQQQLHGQRQHTTRQRQLHRPGRTTGHQRQHRAEHRQHVHRLDRMTQPGS